MKTLQVQMKLETQYKRSFVRLRGPPKYDAITIIIEQYPFHFERDICTTYDNKRLKLLYQKNMMRDFPTLKENNKACEGCLLGKQHRLVFSTRKAWRAKDMLELIHTDICRLMRTPSLYNNRYFILFIDDFSRMTWLYFFKEKSKIFGIFKKFKALAEKQRGKHIKLNNLKKKQKERQKIRVHFLHNNNKILQVKQYSTIKYHFIREMETTKQIQLKYYTIEEQVINIFTKALPKI
uniref:Retrovirus-related Pol polyprotein from transposon TNT 1-94 n=1 Tax=Cajanus cajan TaxID=3821 RepID=A0A151RA85_CAJCA|nr:Retrovirus-related Pol polyprotein from transposon TNT 1-94 [Cajanus cajan]